MGIRIASSVLPAGKSVAETLTAGTPSAVVKCLDLDTADINSIKQLANVVKQEYDQQIDLLVRVCYLRGRYQPCFRTNASHRGDRSM